MFMRVFIYFFFFSSRRRHTRCSRDWSSDVCSSDLHDMMRQLDEAILQARFDDTVHVLVLRGHGEKFFSAGANIAYLNSITPRYKYFFCLHANETLNRLEHTPKLTIAALNGHTVGGGLEIAMA